MSFRVYKFGLLPPTKNAELVHEQISKAHKYRNTLVEIERKRRADTREAMSVCGNIPALLIEAEQSKAKLGEVLLTIKKKRGKDRERSETDEMKNDLKTARLDFKNKQNALKEARKVERESIDLKNKLDIINNSASEQAKIIYNDCGAFWGTKGLIRDAMQASKNMPYYDGIMPNDPCFVRWTGEGQVGVQLQGGLPKDSIFAQDNQLQIHPVDEKAWYSESRSERRKLSRTVLKMRISSDEKRKPIFAEWPIIMDRPLPDKSVIKKAVVNMRKDGPRIKWTIDITVDEINCLETNSHGTGTVGLDIGWRIIDNTMRVGTYYGDDGTLGNVILDKHTLGGFTKAEDIRSIRDKNFTPAIASYYAWIKDQENIPEWMNPAGLHQWRSQARLASLCKRWKDNRIVNDDIAYNALETWRYHDYHLWQWESGQRRKTMLARKEQYRIIAANLATQYETLVLESSFTSKLSRRKPTDIDLNSKGADSNRPIASTYELCIALKNAFISRGGKVIEVPPANTSKQCNGCKHINDIGSDLIYICANCKTEHDRDENAARNICERGCDEQKAGSARNDEDTNENGILNETRWETAKRMAAEKAIRMEAARKANVKVA